MGVCCGPWRDFGSVRIPTSEIPEASRRADLGSKYRRDLTVPPDFALGHFFLELSAHLSVR